MLDVGCGATPKGDVNVDFFMGGYNPQTGDQVRGDFMSPRKIENFVAVDAMHLPFKDESFNVVFSSHTIEHVQDPFLMFREMCRIARRKVIVRCPHRKGSGAVMPFHVNVFDEEWFKKATNALGYKGQQFITTFDYPISAKLEKSLLVEARNTLPWRALKRFERARLMKKIHVPWEVEAWVKKHNIPANTGDIRFVVVYNTPKVFRECFSSSTYVLSDSVTAYHNEKHDPLPKFYNQTIKKYLKENVWLVFCHQDFILNEDLQSRLKTKDVQAIYGPIGGRGAADTLIGLVTQRDGTTIGCQLEKDTPVQTLDEMCLIAHSSVFREGMSFDERFGFHFYGADFCMQAYNRGFDVLVTPLKCQHKSRTIHGDVASREYTSSLKLFRDKWQPFLPIRTTTTIVT